MLKSSRRYRAFISYSQCDKRVAKRLHEALERYRLPTKIGDRILEKDQRSLGRFFRDDTDLGAASDLGASLRGALDDSDGLIVICSPAAATSRWVNAEIEHFRSTAPGRKICAVIAPRTANANIQAEGCFPPSLQFSPAAAPDDPMSNEPLGIVLSQGNFDRAITRLASELLGLDFDDLWNRHERRVKRNRRIAGGLGVSALLVTLILGYPLILERERTAFFQFASELLAAGEPGLGFTYLLASLGATSDGMASKQDRLSYAIEVGMTSGGILAGKAGELPMAGGYNRPFFFAYPPIESALIGNRMWTLSDSLPQTGKYSRPQIRSYRNRMHPDQVTADGRWYLAQEDDYETYNGFRSVSAADNWTESWLVPTIGQSNTTKLGTDVSVNLSPLGNFVLTVPETGEDLDAILWNLETTPPHQLKLPGLEKWHFSPTGDLVFSRSTKSGGSIVSVVHRNSDIIRSMIPSTNDESELPGPVLELRYTGTGQRLAVTTAESLRVYSVVDRILLTGIYPDTTGGVLSPDGAWLMLTGSHERHGPPRSVLASAKDPSLEFSLGGSYSGSFSSDGRWLVTVQDVTSRDGRPNIIDLSDLQASKRIGALAAATFSSDDKWLLATYRSGESEVVRLEDTETIISLGEVKLLARSISGDWTVYIDNNVSGNGMLRAVRLTAEPTVFEIGRMQAVQSVYFLTDSWIAVLTESAVDESWVRLINLDHLPKPNQGARRNDAQFKLICAGLPPFPLEHRQGELRSLLAGRPWNPCDWRGLFYFGDGFEGFRQAWRRFRILYLDAEDYKCGEYNSRGETNRARAFMCEISS